MNATKTTVWALAAALWTTTGVAAAQDGLELVVAASREGARDLVRVRGQLDERGVISVGQAFGFQVTQRDQRQLGLRAAEVEGEGWVLPGAIERDGRAILRLQLARPLRVVGVAASTGPVTARSSDGVLQRLEESAPRGRGQDQQAAGSEREQRQQEDRPLEADRGQRQQADSPSASGAARRASTGQLPGGPLGASRQQAPAVAPGAQLPPAASSDPLGARPELMNADARAEVRLPPVGDPLSRQAVKMLFESGLEVQAMCDRAAKVFHDAYAGGVTREEYGELLGYYEAIAKWSRFPLLQGNTRAAQAASAAILTRLNNEGAANGLMKLLVECVKQIKPYDDYVGLGGR